MKALGRSTTPQNVHIEFISVELTKVNELEDYGVWRFKYESTWKDERLKWPTECQQEEKGIPDYVESELLDILWNPINAMSDVAEIKQPTCQQTLRIRQVNTLSISFISKPYN